MAQGGGSPLARLHALGQSIWLDNIQRSLIRSGGLERLIAEDSVTGVTSNPTIFEKAIDGSSDYDASIAAGAPDESLTDLYRRLTEKDIAEAADVLRPIYDATGGEDGYVSVEVPPDLCRDSAATVAEGERLKAAIGRPNVMVKVPATPEGVRAVEELIFRGVNVNVTLMFSLDQFRRVAEAHRRGLERRLEAGLGVGGIGSVASFFVSRVDTKVDAELEALARGAAPERQAALRRLAGKAGIANARQAYRLFRAGLATDRWRRLAEAGALCQRPLWASTGTKNPAYSDVLYVDGLAGPLSVDTMPPHTLEAYRDHGDPKPALSGHADEDRELLEALRSAGVDLDRITDTLLSEGLEAFAASFDTLMAGLERKRQALRGAAWRAVTEQFSPDAAAVVASALRRAEADGVVRRLFEGDVSLWGGDTDSARAKAIRDGLGWRDLPGRMRRHVPALRAFARQAAEDGLDCAVLLGMGGSSLCPDLLRATFAPAEGALALRVLDSTDPLAVRRLGEALDVSRTLFIVSSKSGTTTEPNAFMAYFWDLAERALGAEAAGAHFTAVTDPGTRLAAEAASRGMRRVWENPPDVGGRYSALSLFGLVPAALLGIDVDEWLERGQAMLRACGPDVSAETNPGLRLGVALAALALAGRDKVTLVASPGVALIGDWLEQLLAESTGKEGRGLVPVAHEPLGPPDVYGADRLFVRIRLGEAPEPETDAALAALAAAGQPVITIRMASPLDLAGEFVRWEVATAVAGHLLGINAFDQPNVQESKDNTVALLDSAVRQKTPIAAPSRRDLGDGLAVEAGASDADRLEDCLAWLKDQVQAGGYVAIMAYLAPDAAVWDRLTVLRRAIRDATRAATTLAWGPRFLHSTGQLHKGGPACGVFLQVVRAKEGAPDLPIPGWPYGFADLIAAQALGDLKALAKRGRPVLRLAVAGDAAAAASRLATAAHALGGAVRS